MTRKDILLKEITDIPDVLLDELSPPVLAETGRG